VKVTGERMDRNGFGQGVPMSENHIRTISTTLALLDKALCEFQQWAQGREIRSVLYEIRNPLSVAQRELIAQEVPAMKGILEDVRATLNLELSVPSADKMITGSCAVLWAWLSELERRHLGKYGEVPPGLSEFLDPKVAELIRRLRNISEAAARGGLR
jgi:hypothetical protein